MGAEELATDDPTDATNAISSISNNGAAQRVSSVLAWVDRDRTAQLAGWILWPVALLVLMMVGRDQWFARDDWAFLFTRQVMGDVLGIDDMLLAPQDGHWMLWPLLVFRGLYEIFGVGSYWPYLIALWVTHIVAVALARKWMLRFGVSAWTATLTTTLLLIFGAGWENLLFAVQITYNMSLAAFLGHLLLADHDGPLDRRDAIGAVLGLVSVSSSGFGPFFLMGTLLLLILRRRWVAAAVAVVPQSLALGWWWLTWGADPAGDQGSVSPRFAVHFARVGIDATFGNLAGSQLLAGAGLVLCIGVVVWPGVSAATRVPALTFLITATAMFVGVGLQREIFGVEAAAWSRYQYMAAFLVAPVFAYGLDQAHRFAPWANWIVRVLLVFAIARNVMWLHDGAQFWSAQSSADRRVFELVAGSPERFDVAPDRSMTTFSPDVRVYNLEELVDSGAITPRVPATAEEQLIVDQALGLVATAAGAP